MITSSSSSSSSFNKVASLLSSNSLGGAVQNRGRRHRTAAVLTTKASSSSSSSSSKSDDDDGDDVGAKNHLNRRSALRRVFVAAATFASSSSALANENMTNIEDDRRTTLYAETVKIRKFEDPDAFQKDVQYLSSCPEVSESCVSTTNDDEGHFLNPWGFSMSKANAMRELVMVALGNKEGEGYFSYDEGRDSRVSTAVRGASVGIEAMRKKARESALRDLALEEKGGGDLNTSSMPEMKGPLGDCIEYDVNNGKIVLRLFDVPGGVKDPDIVVNESDVFDAEFYFLDNDAIVDVRIAARDAPKGGSFALSYDQGIKFEKNRARNLADQIRQKLGWEIVPVIASFDPKWDSKRRMWFEDILDPQENISGEWNSFSGTSWIPNPAAIVDKLSSR